MIAGIGAVSLALVVLPVVAGVGKPVAKSLIKGGFVCSGKSRGSVVETSAIGEDMVASVKAEMAESQSTEVLASTEENPTETVPEPG